MPHGTEGLMSAIASNKTSPEIISNYTKVVFKNRLDILLGLKTKNVSSHEKNLELYKELITAANKFYDLVIVDLSKTTDRLSTHNILGMSDVVVYTMSQNLKQINQYLEFRNAVAEIANKPVIPVMGNMNHNCKYNPKNIANYTKAKDIGYVFYNHAYLEAASEAKVADFFLSARINRKLWDTNSQFFESIGDVSKNIITKFEEIKYGKVSHS